MNLLEDVNALITSVMIVAIEVIGVVQWLKNFSNTDEKKSHRKTNAVTALLILVPCALVQTILVPSLITIVFNILFLALAVEQLAYEAIVKGIPTVVNGLFDKIVSVSKKEEPPPELL